MTRLSRSERRQQLVADLTAVRARIERPEAWTQGVAARNRKGVPVDWRAPSAVCFCLSGHALRLTGGDDLRFSAICAALRPYVGRGIADWNDAADRTHADVVAAVDAALAKAKEETA